MTEAHPVRIPTRRTREAPPGPEGGPLGEAGAPISEGYRANVGGSKQTRATFVAFLAGLLVLYVGFVGILSSSPTPGERSNVPAYALFTLVLVALALGGFLLTLYRAPRGLRREGNDLVVVERTGRISRFALGPGLEGRVLKRYPPDPFHDLATELVRLNRGDGSGRTYLIERGLLPEGTTKG